MRAGIDYSGPGATCNRDPETGIRYGLIPLHSLGDEALEEFESIYVARCPHCGDEIPEDTHFTMRSVKRPGGAITNVHATDCPACGKLIREDDQYGDEADAQVCNLPEFNAHLDSSNDVWITKSPYFTRAAFCSPCAPGACYLNNPTDDGERCFCPGHDWFGDKPTPFPIYSVATGELVERAS